MSAVFFVILSVFQIISFSALDWDYDDQDSWKYLPDAYCGGNTQSPIYLDEDSLDFNCPSRVSHNTLMWRLNTENDTFRLINNGHSISLKAIYDINNDFGLSSNYINLDSSSNTIGKLQNNFATTIGEHKLFCLDSFHFHWGRSNDVGSEHIINNIQYPLEIHFVHYSCDYNSINDAMTSNPVPYDPYILGVVSVIFDIGKPNIFIDKMVDQIDSLIDYHDEIEITMLNIRDLIPTKNTQFYYYKGSLTTPPCTEVVQWHVLSHFMTVSNDQMERLRKIFNAEGNLMAPNFRDIQDNTNTVHYCSSDDQPQIPNNNSKKDKRYKYKRKNKKMRSASSSSWSKSSSSKSSSR